MTSPLETPHIDNPNQSLAPSGDELIHTADGSVSTAQPHAGLEQPVDEFSTPLAKALEEGVVDPIPDSPEHHPATSTGDTLVEDEGIDTTTDAPHEEEDHISTLPEDIATRGLTNPFMEKAQQANGGKRRRGLWVGAGTALVGLATVVGIMSAGSGGGNKASADKNPSAHPTGTTYTMSPDRLAGIEVTPISLNDAFLNLIMTDGSPKSLSESYDLFNADAKSRMTREQWIQTMTNVSFAYHTTTPELQNNDELISAADTHQTVVAESTLVGNNGNYNITVQEIYNPQTKHWEVDNFDSTKVS